MKVLTDTSTVIDYLTSHGIRPSAQRIAIMRYLMENRIHPTADDIYSSLVGSMPTLSRTTVYNTLWLFVEQNAIIVLEVDRLNAHFDYIDKPHAHFYCRCCRRIEDIMIDDAFMADAVDKERFYVEHTSLFYKGMCRQCQEK